MSDDAQVPPDFLARLAAWTCQLPDDWGLLLLGWWDRGGSSRVPGSPDLRRVRRFWMLHAYLINERGMRKLARGAGPARMPSSGKVNHTPFDRPTKSAASSAPSGLYLRAHPARGARTARRASARAARTGD